MGSASLGASRRASPVPQQPPNESPVLVSDSSTAHTFNYQDECDYSTPQLDLLGMPGPYSSSGHYYSSIGSTYPAPYHPEYLQKTAYNTSADIAPYLHDETSGNYPFARPQMWPEEYPMHFLHPPMLVPLKVDNVLVASYLLLPMT